MFCIDYSNLPSTDWASCLLQANQSYSGKAELPIYWGAHEKIQGVLDFTQNSRLRLEKVLALAHNQKVSLRVRLGFDGDERSFPLWTKNLSPKAIVPQADGKVLFEEIQTRVAPSLLNDEAKNGFFAFLEEVFNILSLYSQPQGPVESISFSWGALQFDSNLIDSKNLSHYLQSRYESITQLNSLYQTCFRDFDSAASRMGIRTLFDKRPWIAAWDFKNGRTYFLRKIEKEIISKLDSRGLSTIAQISENHDFEDTTETTPILIEDTLIETLGGGIGSFPLMVLGQLTPAAISAFRLAEGVRFGAYQNGSKVLSLSQWTPSSSTTLATVLASKFISERKASLLLDWASKGGKLFFPFGLPQWDEKLSIVKWGESVERERKVVEEEELVCSKCGNGQILLPVKDWDKGAQFHARLRKVTEALK